MKKSIIAFTISGLMLSAAVNAAPQENTVYVGAKAGWASFHDGVKQLDAKHYNNTAGYGINRNSVTYGAFVGYQILNQDNFGLATEVSYEFFGRNRGLQNPHGLKTKETFNHRAYGTVISLKPSYEVLSGLDIYGRVGVALVNNTYKTVSPATYIRTQDKRFQTSLVLGGGVEYAILPELALNVEYQWLNNAGKASRNTIDRINYNSNSRVTDYRPDIGMVTAGITYRFGQEKDVAPEIITKNFAFNSDVLFDFGKANLKPTAVTSLDSAYTEISGLGLKSPSIQVNGYTDRIGKEKSNLKLSQRRAESVANYMVSKGVSPENMTVVGYGEANPVTGNTCDTVKGRKALISCLAPDRRVELKVQGSKQVEM